MTAPDLSEIESGGKRWHGEDHRVIHVRWEPYKPDGQRQMKAKGRWQEQVGSGDYWRWQNCDRPQNLTASSATPDPLSDPRVKALVEALQSALFWMPDDKNRANWRRRARAALRAIEEDR